MTKIDPQKKDVKYFVPIYTGLIHNYAETSKLSAFQIGLYVTIHAQADFSTGIWMGSAYKLLATVPRDNSLQACQRALRHMVDIGLLKHFRGDGVRGNTAYCINKFKIRSGERSGQVLNATKSTSLENLVYDGDAVSDAVSDTVGDAVREPIATQGDAFLRSKEVKNLESKESKESKKKEGKEAEPLSPDLQRLVTELEQKLWGQMAGWDWDRLTGPQYRPIRKWFQEACADLGMFSKSNRLYEDAMERVRSAVEIPAERICPNPIGPLTEKRLQELIAEDPDCTGGEMLPDGSGKMYFALGTQWISSDGKPRWCPTGSNVYHAFDGEPTEEEFNEARESVLAHTMPDAPSDAPTVSA